MASSSKVPEGSRPPVVSSSSVISGGSKPPTSPPPPSPPGPLIPEALRSLLDWNPPVLNRQSQERGGSVSTAIGTRKFYDKHLTPDLILKHLQYHSDLAAQIASTVDTAIEAALADGGTLPPSGVILMEESDRDDHVAGVSNVMTRELTVTSFYLSTTAHLCIPVASTLALHPKVNRWLRLLTWSMVPNAASFAVSDGSLQILNIDDDETMENDARTSRVRAEIRASMNPQMLETTRKLIRTYPDLAVWEMKSLTVGDDDLMVGLRRSAHTGRPFNWETCLCDGDQHPLDRMDAVKNTRAGPDAPSTPWTLPEVYEEFTQSVYASDTDDGDENEARDPGGDQTSTVKSPPVTADQDYSTASGFSDTERETIMAKGKGKGKGDDAEPSNARKKSGKSPTKSPTKRKRRDGGYKSAASDGAESFVQQGWAQAVRTDSTIIVLHTGNAEYVCVRHRESQTLYVSDIIHPPTCKAPAYGKLHIGIYIAAIQDAIQRMEYGETLPEDKRSKLPPNFTKFNKKNGPAGGGGAGGGSRGGNKRQKKDGDEAPRGRGKGRGMRPEKRGSGSKSKRRTRANLNAEREEQAKTILEANRRDIVLVYLCYGVYKSHNPAAFFRKAPAIVQSGQTPTPPPTPKPRTQYAPGTYSTIIITSEIGEGSTGKVHGGIFTLNAGDQYIDVDVAVKLSFEEDEQDRLMHEYFMYCHLDSKGVKGIPTVLGLFVDPEDGPSALVLTHGGESIFNRSQEIEYFQREAFQTTLKAIHAAGVLHRDIRSPNLLIDEFGESFIIDFDQAEKIDSESAQKAEFKRLSRILEGKGG